ncbi:myosin class 2 heavy chain [Niveomyces insectorum RCEF 264]|uniref:Myosin class 2 heavy chain n=1 Tax=Niveomyces insectorum RCEF 264 TaxID=1081102 RepID=A0A167VBC1_9HYPO|nr:myosin class 2 heavy chain [Niveomyces insectorum RCEF 264]
MALKGTFVVQECTGRFYCPPSLLASSSSNFLLPANPFLRFERLGCRRTVSSSAADSRCGLFTTSSPSSSHNLPPGAPAQEAGSTFRPRTPSSPRSPALSSASTADAGPSPPLPALQLPRLPPRASAFLRTPPSAHRYAGDASENGADNETLYHDAKEGGDDEEEDDDDESHFVTASWGSPYPRSDVSHLQLSSFSSEPSEDTPIHHLELQTPFLRPAPYFPGAALNLDSVVDDDDSSADGDERASQDAQGRDSPPFSAQQHLASSFVSAAVLANRARRPARGLTEDWIRQHTTGDFGSEAALWLSDRSEKDSETSSLSGSVSGGDRLQSNREQHHRKRTQKDQHDDDDDDDNERLLRTPRALPEARFKRFDRPHSSPHGLVSASLHRHKHTHRIRSPSSLETLRESDLQRRNRLLQAQINIAVANAVMESAVSVHEADSGPSSTAESVVAVTAAAGGTVNDASTDREGPETAPATPPGAESAALPLPEAVPLPPPSTPPPRESPDNKRDPDSQPGMTNGSPADASTSTFQAPAIPSPKKTPRRQKKKLPWKGKTILVLLPIDEERGKPGHAPMPLPQTAVSNMLRSWEELGYDVDGFDLDRSASPTTASYGLTTRSMSRTLWPNEEDIARERAARKYPVLLPDLNAWKNYVEELNEAKLRALGVSFGDEEPPLPPSISPGVGAPMSRQSSTTVYPPLPFSPPIPPSSTSSLHGGPPFSFPGAFVPGAAGLVGLPSAPSPSNPSGASPTPFGVNARYNGRQSISIPAGAFQMPPLQQTTPGGYSPQALLLQQGLARGASPSLAALSSVMSPTSPFTPDNGFTSPPLHQRHQSLQYPLTQYPQLQTSARASPRLQELREVEEEAEDKTLNKSPSKTPEAASHGAGARPFVQHNASLSLQKEIDDAEYHLEEQFRSQFEHDRDYSPHGGKDLVDAFGIRSGDKPDVVVPQHARGMSVQFAPPPPIQRFRDDAENGPPLLHPRPHSRGHSLANTYYVDPEEARNKAAESNLSKPVNLAPVGVPSNASNAANPDDSYEIETNPSNLGTPIQNLPFSTVLQEQQTHPPHQPSFSNASNPWSEANSFSGKASAAKRSSHGSKASLSNLNVEAPEFKFNPGNSSAFKPTLGGQFLFGSSNAAEAAFQPSVFQAGLVPNAPLSANSSQFSLPTTATTSSKINVNAPTFSPSHSDFSFSAIGPKFRPDAPAFTPLHSFSNSLTSPIQSGSESATGGHRTSSIFGNIDLTIPDVVKPSKRSKAVPIIRPASRHSPQPAADAEKTNDETQYDKDGRIASDDSRVKRAKGSAKEDGNDEILFAEPSPVAEDVPVVVTSEDTAKIDFANKVVKAENTGEEKGKDGTGIVEEAEADVQQAGADEGPEHAEVAEKDVSHDDEDESGLAAEDTTLSSTAMSESTDAKLPATTSPSELSPLQSSVPWAPFEFKSDLDMASFNSARPMGEDIFRHKKSLSATAKPFTPGASFQGSTADEAFDDERLPDIVLPTTEAVEEEQQLVASEAPSFVEKVEESQLSSPPPPPPPPATEKPRGLAASRYARLSPPPSPPPKAVDLSSPPYATSSPPPVPSKDEEYAVGDGSQSTFEQPVPVFENDAQDDERMPAPPSLEASEMTFQEIDEIMRHLNETDPAQGVNKTVGSPSWQQPVPAAAAHVSLAAAASESPLHLPVPSPTRSYQQLTTEQTQEPLLSTELEDPFLDPPISATAQSFVAHELLSHGNASGGSMPPSEWEGDFTDEEQRKLESRVNFFDGHVNDIVGGILTARLDPLEKSLDRIQHAIASISRATPPSRRERRSISGEVPESDADDEDDDMPPVPRRSMSPRKDRRLDQMRAAVLDALTVHHQRSALPEAASSTSLAPAQASLPDESVALILKHLEDVKEQFGQSLRLDFRGEDLRNIVEDAVERRMPPSPLPAVLPAQDVDEEKQKDTESLHARIAELEEQLRLEEAKTQSEMAVRRIADDQTAELRRKLELAETKIEIEIMNRSAYDQRVADLEDRLKHQQSENEAELAGRRAAEDRLSEVQRLLRIASEEEVRLREALDERDEKLKTIDESSEKDRMRLASLEASQVNREHMHSDLQNRLNTIDTELREKAQESRHWRAEAERAIDLSQRQCNDLVQTATELKHMKRVVDTLGTQLEENEHLREAWRTKFVALQEDMARAAREVAEESARHIKREQTLLARQETLDAKLQAEARTRERLESELERLEGGERQAMRAVAECKRLEGLLGELRTENHKLQQSSLRYQAEFEEARESAAREVQRTRDAMQAEVDEANHQVNVVRGDLEDQIARVRGQLDQVKLDADTSRARLEMLLEEAESTKRTALEEAEAAQRDALAEAEGRHQNQVEDLQARYERQISNVTEDAQRAEQNLLERLSISTSKTEHLQDRVAHLEEKLEIAREAAQAAAKAAKGGSNVAAAAATADSVVAPTALQPAASVKAFSSSHHGLGLPEKISPQALRESILVLQEQLQQREQTIEELEHTLSEVDPDADSKIAKRDDEIMWLRELLAVRHADLKDIITALGRENHDPDRVRDAVIRLQANLQMEEQERERAVNGGSAIKLPTIAATIRDAATPRVAQAVGPLAAAWGNWRKGRDSTASNAVVNTSGTFGSLSSALMSSPAGAAAPPSSSSRLRRGEGGAAATSAAATPSRAPSSSISSRASFVRAQSNEDSSFLSGLMTPPTSGMRQTPPSRSAQQQQQPTAFSSTGRRYTGGQPASRRAPTSDNKLSLRGDDSSSPPPSHNRRTSRGQPVTPPMMRRSAYDSDAHAEEFDGAAFFDD